MPFKAPLTSVSLIETGTKEAEHSTLMLPPIERNVFVIHHMSQVSLLAILRNYVQFSIMRSVWDVCLLDLLAPTKRCA
jgi:hypothetical protein